MFKVRIPLFEMAGEIGSEAGVEVAAEAAQQAEVEPTEEQPTGEQQAEAGSKKGDPDTAWEKRISSMRQKWEQEAAEKYKDYDTYKDVAEYFKQSNNMQDVLSLKEAIELERLQARADQQNVPPEVLKRIDELEAKAAEGEQLKQEQQLTQQLQSFRANLEKFVEGKDVKADDLHKFMYENQIGNVEVAYKAMEADVLREKLATAEKEGMNKLLKAKGSMPKVEGNGQTGLMIPGKAKSFADARARAEQRLSHWGNMEG